MNDNTIWTKEDAALSADVAARIDAMRFFKSDISDLTDDELRRRFATFQGHIITITELMDDMPNDDIGSLLVKTVELIEVIYIASLESEMARRWRNE